MKRLDHLEHLDPHLVDELAQVARETVRDELREQTRRQRRTAALYAASGAVALYAGAALALAFGLALALGLPDWAAALITAAVLGVAAYVLRGAARPSASRPTPERQAEIAPETAEGRDRGDDRVVGGTAPTGAPGGHRGQAYPPMPTTPPGGGPPQQEVDPEAPHHRA
ncbi:phage holin family protein [Streptomyces sp. NPDC002845]